MKIVYILRNQQGIQFKTEDKRYADGLTRHGWQLTGQYIKHSSEDSEEIDPKKDGKRE